LSSLEESCVSHRGGKLVTSEFAEVENRDHLPPIERHRVRRIGKETWH
jgi:hypothetical protein